MLCMRCAAGRGVRGRPWVHMIRLAAITAEPEPCQAVLGVGMQAWAESDRADNMQDAWSSKGVQLSQDPMSPDTH